MADLELKDTVFCHKCNKALNHIDITTKISRQDQCPFCTAHLRCCKMCHFFDPTAYNECKEHIAERLLEKEKANFCEYYTPLRGPKNFGKEKETLLNAAASLFKNK